MIGVAAPNQPSDRVDTAVQAQIRATVKEFRAIHGLSRTKLAEKAGISLWMLSMFENGDRQLSLEGALRLCHAMEMKLWEILRKVEN